MEANVEKVRPKNTGTRPLFDNPILEALSRTHIAVPITIYLVTATILGWYAFTYTDMTAGWIGTLFLSGILVFSLIEYATHRGVFHMETNTSLKAKIQYTFHGIHHEYPKDKTRLAMPPAMAVFVGLALFSVTFLLLGEASYAFFPGFLVGYSGYLFVHFIVHAYKPPKNFFKWLWINHAVHHYKSHEKNYGVSSPLWDYVFGTYMK
ncbi:sterol desaturase family protein [Tellurirhabdus bombi]|uniref:sterol desaturase family protein n=1 Tax=Tellurirhabdus bombi TaxID=2907205 RepID=UPI001F1CFB56|nr:sterol desaturase family protein [Tellurirhabdus bombi]